MNITLSPRDKIVCTKGVTMLMEANHNYSNNFVRKKITWDDVLTEDD